MRDNWHRGQVKRKVFHKFIITISKCVHNQIYIFEVKGIRAIFIFCRTHLRKFSRDPFVRYSTNCYAVGPRKTRSSLPNNYSYTLEERREKKTTLFHRSSRRNTMEISKKEELVPLLFNIEY